MVKKVFMVPIRLYSYSTNSNKNNILISQFIKLKTNQSDVYKKKAYQNAINILKLFPLSLTSAEEIKRVPGIGKSLSLRISNFLKNGSIAKVEDSKVTHASDLLRLDGIGYSKLEKLQKLYNIKNFEDYKNYEKKDELNFFSEAQLLELEVFDELSLNLTENELLKWKDCLKNFIDKLNVKLKFEEQYLIYIPKPFKNSNSILIKFNKIEVWISKKYMHEDDANENFFNKFKSDFEEDLKSSKIFYQLLSVDNGAIKFIGKLEENNNNRKRYVRFKYIPYEQFYLKKFKNTCSNQYYYHIKSLLLEKNIVIEKNGLRKNFIFGNGNKKGKYFKVHENGDEKNEVDHKEVEKIKIFSEEDIFNVLGIKFVEESERMTSM